MRCVEVVQSLAPSFCFFLFFLQLFTCIKLPSSVMRMSSYNCDHNSVLRATILLLMQTCSHLGSPRRH